jgi:hypothetical protein
MTNTLAPTKTWKTALKMEGFPESHPFDQSDLDSMSKTMGILTQEGIEIWELWRDNHSENTKRNVIAHSHLARLFPQPEGMNVEDYLHYLLDQID